MLLFRQSPKNIEWLFKQETSSVSTKLIISYVDLVSSPFGWDFSINLLGISKSILYPTISIVLCDIVANSIGKTTKLNNTKLKCSQTKIYVDSGEMLGANFK